MVPLDRDEKVYVVRHQAIREAAEAQLPAGGAKEFDTFEAELDIRENAAPPSNSNRHRKDTSAFAIDARIETNSLPRRKHMKNCRERAGTSPAPTS